MKTNRDKLVKQSVIGEVHSPNFPASPYRISSDGVPMIVHATGGIVYNFKIGDSCMDLYGDHIEPGVSIKNPVLGENNALNILSCIGNEAKVVSGEARGRKGFVTGTHGGIEHVLIYFDEETLDLLAIGDKIQVKAFGQGLRIEGLDDLKIMNLDPDLMEKIDLEVKDGKLIVPVVTEIPSHLLGSGIGADGAKGDYDIMTGDRAENEKYAINDLKFGDLVLLRDADTSFGRQHLTGAVTVGVVIHSDCIKGGHGPGVTSIFTSKTSSIVGRLDKEANIANYLGVK